MTLAASSRRPLRIRNSGDSGTLRRTQNTSRAGSTMTIMVRRQSANAATSQADTKPHSAAPTGHQPSMAVRTLPRCFRGVNSPTSA
jgi:hypothetical protein